MHPFTRTSLTAAALVCGALAPAAPALAAPAGNAPECVAVWQSTGRVTKTGYARNDCGKRLRLKIVWARGTDGACFTVDPGQTISSQVPRGIRTFDGANSC
ncbi:hypothetical protein [Nonomuraea sp. SBT364]|uniref:hypothetical protein n=1 Tax=Nonomuraea sp. SBT364 TaxID=1580530 RepID=UPI00066D671D|nr:hypothetical protein [Nonomuraea sp. SBT364]